MGLLPPAAAPAGGRGRRAGAATTVEDELYSERFLVRRPLLRAIDHRRRARRRCCSIDEVDRADDEFEAFLLEILSDYSVTVPELGTFHAEVPPIVVVTSNRTRDVHDALKRRCLYHWVEHPDFEREVAIVRLRAPEVPERLARQVAAAVEALRELELYKPPGVAETIDWAHGARRARPHRARRAHRRRHPRHRPQVPRGPGAGARRHGVGRARRRRGGAQCLSAAAPTAERRPRSRSAFARVLRGAGLDVPVGTRR